jgi:two-component system cell cycle response regulator DivK
MIVMDTSVDLGPVSVIPPVAPSGAETATNDPRAPLIFLVDDSLEDIDFYEAYMIAAGFRVVTATTGREAVELALSLVPDLVVMDLEMPGIDGWEATRILGRHEETMRIPVLALSGFHGTAMVMRAICAGCSGFLPKPCLARELEAAIRSTLERAKAKDSTG